MKVLFAGPSLSGADLGNDLMVLGPAMQGDIVRVTLQGATAIGLVDGLFEDVAAVWHKELLFALAKGVTVIGGASMGALRAAECDAFGMIGIGEIYGRYSDGSLDDDAAVAQLHAPAELGYTALTEALVNVEATLTSLVERMLISRDEHVALLARASDLHFKGRTLGAIAKTAMVAEERRGEIALALRDGKVDLKRKDALLVVNVLAAAPSKRAPEPPWKPEMTRTFRTVLDQTGLCHGVSR